MLVYVSRCWYQTPALRCKLAPWCISCTHCVLISFCMMACVANLGYSSYCAPKLPVEIYIHFDFNILKFSWSRQATILLRTKNSDVFVLHCSKQNWNLTCTLKENRKSYFTLIWFIDFRKMQITTVLLHELRPLLEIRDHFQKHWRSCNCFQVLLM